MVREVSISPRITTQLKRIFQRQLEEPRIRSIVLKEFRTANISAIGVVVLNRGIPEGRMIEHVKGIGAELQILLAPRGEVLEERHIHAIVSRAVDCIRSAAEKSNCVRSTSNW